MIRVSSEGKILVGAEKIAAILDKQACLDSMSAPKNGTPGTLGQEFADMNLDEEIVVAPVSIEKTLGKDRYKKDAKYKNRERKVAELRALIAGCLAVIKDRKADLAEKLFAKNELANAQNKLKAYESKGERSRAPVKKAKHTSEVAAKDPEEKSPWLRAMEANDNRKALSIYDAIKKAEEEKRVGVINAEIAAYHARLAVYGNQSELKQA